MTKQIVHEDLSIFFFTESERFEGDGTVFPSSFFTKNILTATPSGLMYFNACGIFIEASSTYVIFPKGLITDEMDEASLIDHAGLLVQVFRKYNLKQNVSIQSEAVTSKQIEDSSAVFSLLDLLEDYLSHGPLVRETVIRESGYNGRIDWRQTINKITPLISKDTVHYLPPVIKRKVYERESMIQKIHLRCVADSFRKFGWIYGLGAPEEFFDVPDLDMGQREILRLLHAELRMTFFDRDIHVIKLMIRYFEEIPTAKSENPDSVFMYSLHFHTVFETMCMSVFNGMNAAEFDIPKPSWHMADGSIKTTSQIPDVLFVEDEELYILDAKYYDYRYTLPGWGDLVKQHFYGFAFEGQYKSIHNIFLLPGAHKEMFDYIGFSIVPMVKVFSESKIYGFTIDCFTLMSLYTTNRFSNSRAELLKKLLQSREI
ncbi:LlaJI family restriction endonuclease [Exiguobacterium sp. AB2]|uniref:LlaJI family restriction endonuclease n=1 Tax=Exiguobacterium sp. AB2 TaxID=1484479 RepID=UPI0004A8BFD2|nr:LlaJI family restriction endonuclease [Exiguobacterium sp. AB2]KDN57495.1 hypothetical protein DI14_13535 [Exiguobacterium sp. AB2]